MGMNNGRLYDKELGDRRLPNTNGLNMYQTEEQIGEKLQFDAESCSVNMKLFFKFFVMD